MHCAFALATPKPGCNLGNSLQLQDRWEEATINYQQAVQLQPGYGKALSNLAESLRHLKRLPEAIACGERAVQAAPQNALAWCNLGNSLWDSGRLTKAEAAYRSAVRLDPDYTKAWCNLAGVLLEQNRSDEACKAGADGNAIGSPVGRVLERYASCLHARDEWEAAEATYRDAIRRNPQLVEAWCNLGNVLRDLGRTEAAAESYRTALAQKVSSGDVDWLRGTPVWTLAAPPDVSEIRYNLCFSNWNAAILRRGG